MAKKWQYGVMSRQPKEGEEAAKKKKKRNNDMAAARKHDVKRQRHHIIEAGISIKQRKHQQQRKEGVARQHHGGESGGGGNIVAKMAAAKEVGKSMRGNQSNRLKGKEEVRGGRHKAVAKAAAAYQLAAKSEMASISKTGVMRNHVTSINRRINGVAAAYQWHQRHGSSGISENAAIHRQRMKYRKRKTAAAATSAASALRGESSKQRQSGNNS